MYTNGNLIDEGTEFEAATTRQKIIGRILKKKAERGLKKGEKDYFCKR